MQHLNLSLPQRSIRTGKARGRGYGAPAFQYFPGLPSLYHSSASKPGPWTRAELSNSAVWLVTTQHTKMLPLSDEEVLSRRVVVCIVLLATGGPSLMAERKMFQRFQRLGLAVVRPGRPAARHD